MNKCKNTVKNLHPRIFWNVKLIPGISMTLTGFPSIYAVVFFAFLKIYMEGAMRRRKLNQPTGKIFLMIFWWSWIFGTFTSTTERLRVFWSVKIFNFQHISSGLGWPDMSARIRMRFLTGIRFHISLLLWQIFIAIIFMQIIFISSMKWGHISGIQKLEEDYSTWWIGVVKNSKFILRHQSFSIHLQRNCAELFSLTQKWKEIDSYFVKDIQSILEFDDIIWLALITA